MGFFRRVRGRQGMILPLFLLFAGSVFAEERIADSQSPSPETDGGKYRSIPVDAKGRPLPLSLEETIRMVLDNNSLVQIQQLEILKSDTEYLKDESKYAPVLGFGYQGYEKIDKETPSTTFSGTRMNQDKVYANVSKLFSTGTYFQLEVSDTRFDTNAGESTAAQSSSLLSRLAQPPLHTGALTLVLRQELVRNGFGYTQRRLNEIMQNNAEMQRLRTVDQLSQLVVKTMIDYWQLAIADENVQTLVLLLDNTKKIRNLTIRKQNIGLSESFEVNQWNALVASSEIRLNAAKLERNTAKNSLLRVLNLDPDLELNGTTELYEEIPPDLDVEKDIEIALRERPDYRGIKLQKYNAMRMEELSKNTLLPSVTIGGSISSRDQGLHTDSAFNAVPRGDYPEASVEFKVEYPLGDKGANADYRNAAIAYRQVSIQEEQLRRQIGDEVREGMDQIKLNHVNLLKAKEALRQTETFYRGILHRYSQGRFTAEAVKNALDSLVQSRQAHMQMRINFNISLVRYDMIRNQVFQKYGIDINQVIDSRK